MVTLIILISFLIISDNIFQFFKEDEVTKSTTLSYRIATICEKWWIQNRSSKDLVAPQTISFLLVRALDQGGKIADVQRVYEIRAALLLIDFQDER